LPLSGQLLGSSLCSVGQPSENTLRANGSGAWKRNAELVLCTAVLIRQVVVPGRELLIVVVHAQLPPSGAVGRQLVWTAKRNRPFQ
jgi:hypothetical protein